MQILKRNNISCGGKNAPCGRYLFAILSNESQIVYMRLRMCEWRDSKKQLLEFGYQHITFYRPPASVEHGEES